MTQTAKHPRMTVQTQRREYRRYRSRVVVRRRRAALGVIVAVVVASVALGVVGGGGAKRTFAPPSRTVLAGMPLGARIVAVASSQLGYRTDPRNSYCNKYSAFWGEGGSGGCDAGERSEEWCADFAAWAWREAGVAVAYGFSSGEINAGAASFYTWGVDHGSWHPVGSGFRPAPGDVAVYGLSEVGGVPSAAHVAVVTGGPAAAPDVINGDGDHTGFSVVEAGGHESRADTGRGGGAPLAGYVTPD